MTMSGQPDIAVKTGHDEVVTRLLNHADAITRDLEWIKGQAASVPVSQHSIEDLDERAREEIDAAERTVDMVVTVSLAETVSRRSLATALLKAARRGVRVTLLLSAHDLRSPRTMSGIEKLRSQGVHVRIAVHAPSITVLIVDGQTAFIRPTALDRKGLLLRNHEACPALAELAMAYWTRGYVHRLNQLDTGALPWCRSCGSRSSSCWSQAKRTPRLRGCWESPCARSVAMCDR